MAPRGAKCVLPPDFLVVPGRAASPPPPPPPRRATSSSSTASALRHQSDLLQRHSRQQQQQQQQQPQSDLLQRHHPLAVAYAYEPVAATPTVVATTPRRPPPPPLPPGKQQQPPGKPRATPPPTRRREEADEEDNPFLGASAVEEAVPDNISLRLLPRWSDSKGSDLVKAVDSFERPPPSTLEISIAERVLAVREGVCFRARLSSTKAQSLGMTLKSTATDRIFVHALPRSSPQSAGRAEAAGIRAGDEVLGIGDSYFEEHELTSLTGLVERIKGASWCGEDGVVVIVLRRGRRINKQNRMANILLQQRAIDDLQAAVLSSMMLQLQARSEQWDLDKELRTCPTWRGEDEDWQPTARSRPDVFWSGSEDDDSLSELTLDEECEWERQTDEQRLKKSISASRLDYHPRAPLSDSSSSSLNESSSRRPTVPTEERRHVMIRCPVLRTRPALCSRILGTDYAEDHTVYVVWVLDVLAGAEWRIGRRFREFHELHERLVELRPSVENLNFPSRNAVYETMRSVNDRRVRLERYLRKLTGMLHSSRLHPNSAAISNELQHFLDVPKRLDSLELLERNPDVTLRQAVQVAAYQILSLPVFEKILNDIVASTASHTFDSGVEMLVKMKDYIDHLQLVLIQGCNFFFQDVALRRKTIIPIDDLHSIISAAVRRQIETEVFVPLMEKLHALLGDDIEEKERLLRYKCRMAQRRPQTFCGIPLHHISPSSWDSAIYHLRSIGSYTLPCDKLDALLAAAKEIPALYVSEHPSTEPQHLGADDFLPIFIYVLINANISELAYLQKVLCTLCDPDKRLSETGYYVATFEAAVQHISEMELD